MKKELTYEQALQMLKRGEAVTCQLSNRVDDTEVVRDVSRLNYLHDLSKEGTQMCKLYRIPQNKAKIREGAIEVSFDEAYEMLHSGELIYYKENGEEEEITTIPELMNLRRNYELHGKNLLLYWYE